MRDTCFHRILAFNNRDKGLPRGFTEERSYTCEYKKTVRKAKLANNITSMFDDLPVIFQW